MPFTVYQDVSPQTFAAYRRNASPGRFINRNLNRHLFE
jgi:hypothetical protein